MAQDLATLLVRRHGSRLSYGGETPDLDVDLPRGSLQHSHSSILAEKDRTRGFVNTKWR